MTEYAWMPLVLRTANAQWGEHCLGVLLFGSQARGDAVESSDVDVLVVVDSSVRIERKLYHLWDELMPDQVSINIARLPSQPEEAGSLWLECALDAKILHDPTGQLENRLEQIRNLILAGKFVRKTTHGQGYWLTQ